MLLPVQILIVLPQSAAVCILLYIRQIIANTLLNIAIRGEAFLRVILRQQQFIQASQADDIFPHRAMAHLSLLDQIVRERFDIEIIGVCIAGHFTAKTT